MSRFIIIFVVFATIISFTSSAKILGIFPMPSKSHHILGSALLKELASRGHNVTMISPFPLKSPPPNYHDVDLDGLFETKEKLLKVMTNPNSSMWEMSKSMLRMTRFLSTDILEHRNVQKFLSRNETFDVCILLWGFGTETLLGIGETVKAKTIGFTTVGSFFTVNYQNGNSAPYSYVPHFFTSYTDEMDFLQRTVNTVTNLLADLASATIGLAYPRYIYRQYFPNGPPLETLINDIDITLINSHYSTETPRPTLPNLIQIGGFHLQEQQELPDELQNYMDRSEGVIYFSLGTNVRSSDIHEEALNGILKIFSQLKYDILWKFETDLKNKPQNVKISNWLPQRAILNHPNIKAFITHGGFGSITEAVYFGVPMICIPFFGDQEQNVAEVVHGGYAVRIAKNNITGNALLNAINEITGNPKYAEKIKFKSDLFKNQEMNPMEKAVFWVEHAIKHKGAKHLKAKAATLPWYQYMLLDVISFIVTTIFVVIFTLYYIVKKIICICCIKKGVKVKKN